MTEEDSSFLQEALYQAIVRASEIADHLVSWREYKWDEMTVEMKELEKEYNQQANDHYHKYTMHNFETHVLLLLGEYLTTRKDSQINVLDVGSGAGMTAAALFSNAQGKLGYTSIDFKVNPCVRLPSGFNYRTIGIGSTLGLQPMLDTILLKRIEHDHHSFHALDVQDDELKLKIAKQYDVILLDIEPHGCEVELYEKYIPFLKEEHICVVKHCLNRDFAPMYARTFVEKYMSRGLILDYYAEENARDPGDRGDMYLVMRRSALEDRRVFKCQALTKRKLVDHVTHFAASIGTRDWKILEFIPKCIQHMPKKETETVEQ